jgi:hypothetical protein
MVDGPGERGHVWPQFLPDGRHFLYLADSALPEHHNLFVSALGSHARTRLMPLASNATYTRDGYLLFARDRRLIAQPFDATRLALTGAPVTIADEVRQLVGQDHMTDFAVSGGVLPYRSLRVADTALVWRDRAERQSVLVNAPAEYYEPTLSPDQARVAIDVFDPRPSPRFGFNVGRVTSDIWILDASTGRASHSRSIPRPISIGVVAERRPHRLFVEPARSARSLPEARRRRRARSRCSNRRCRSTHNRGRRTDVFSSTRPSSRARRATCSCCR